MTRRPTWTLIGPDGAAFESARPGTLGGHRRSRVYGRLDCPAARRAIARGGYVAHRVFFATVEDARAAGYRPCGACLPGEHGRSRQEEAGMPAKPAARVAALDWERIAADLDRRNAARADAQQDGEEQHERPPARIPHRPGRSSRTLYSRNSSAFQNARPPGFDASASSVTSQPGGNTSAASSAKASRPRPRRSRATKSWRR